MYKQRDIEVSKEKRAASFRHYDERINAVVIRICMLVFPFMEYSISAM